MEDLWRVNSSGIDLENFADMAEYKLYLERFRKEEEKQHRDNLLYGNDESKK